MNRKNSMSHWAAEKAAIFLANHPIALGVLIVLYIVSPIDLVPEALLGPLGYLDDLIMLLLPLLVRNMARRSNPPRPKDYIDTTAR